MTSIDIAVFVNNSVGGARVERDILLRRSRRAPLSFGGATAAPEERIRRGNNEFIGIPGFDQPLPLRTYADTDIISYFPVGSRRMGQMAKAADSQFGEVRGRTRAAF